MLYTFDIYFIVPYACNTKGVDDQFCSFSMFIEFKLNYVFKAELGSIFSKEQNIFSVEDKLLPVIQYGSSGLQKVMTFMIS